MTSKLIDVKGQRAFLPLFAVIGFQPFATKWHK